MIVNGVDVSDPCKNFPTHEWRNLADADYLDCLRQRRAEVHARDPRNLQQQNQQLQARISALEQITQSVVVDGNPDPDEASALTGTVATAASHGNLFGANGRGTGRIVGGRARGRGRR